MASVFNSFNVTLGKTFMEREKQPKIMGTLFSKIKQISRKEFK